ncbi:MAG: hypothetical protein LBJ01_02650 [Tannerella sp.]|nr:hypothetical protein [Tannerella sp.]
MKRFFLFAPFPATEALSGAQNQASEAGMPEIPDATDGRHTPAQAVRPACRKGGLVPGRQGTVSTNLWTPSRKQLWLSFVSSWPE